MKIKKKEAKNNTFLKLLISLIISTFIMSIGYATLNGINLSLTGSANISGDGDVEIISIARSSSSNVTENTPAAVINNGQGVSFDLNVTVNSSNYNQGFYITYLVTIYNDSISEQRILGTTFTPTFTGSGTPPTASYSVTDLNGNPMLNDTITHKTTEQYYLTIHIHPQATGTWGVEGETEVETGDTDTGTVLGSLTGSTQGNLTNASLAHFTASVINSHNSNKTFTLSIIDSKFQIVNQSGNALSSMTINANDTSTYDFYIKVASGSKFMVSPQNINIYLTCDGETQSIGDVLVSVNVDPLITDFDAPTISNVKAEAIATDKTIRVTWNATDANTITNIYLEVYSSNSSGTGTYVTKYNLAGTATSKDVTVSTGDAYYFFKVYGIDQSQNTATANEISSCSTSSGHCSRSENQKFKWYFTVVLTLDHADGTNGTTKSTSNNVTTVTFSDVFFDSNINSTLSGTGTYYAPDEIKSAKITYPGKSQEDLPPGNSSQTAYSYDSSSYVLNVYHIKGDVAIAADGRTCLVEGTDILLADGTYKKVENIGYDDLLAVWNYDTGSLTYEYPIWIENEHSGKGITRITFEDDTYIDFHNNHAVYNTDINLFVDIMDSENFHIGTNVAKINNKGKFEKTKVKKIEHINKEVKYYFIGTTAYYNVIANDVLTTDHNVLISNLYGFEDNAKWPKSKGQIVNNKNNIIDYSYFKDSVPYYMYKGFRAEEVGYLINNGIITINQFKYYLTSNISNPYMVKPPINKNNSNYWMITTSLDKVTNKENYLRKEGSIYTLPINKKVKGWLNTANNKVYKPGDKIVVVHGLHFIAIY